MKLLLLAFLIAAPAHATLSFYDDRAAWEAAVGPVFTEDFESIPITEGAVTLIETPYFDITADGVFWDGYGEHGIRITGDDDNRLFSGDVHDSSEPPGYNRLTLHQPVTAFAFDLYPLWDNEGLYITMGADRFWFEAIGYEDPSARFVGVVSDTPFSVVEFSTDYDNYDVDNVSFPVPEPGTGLLVSLSLAVMAMRRWLG